ncbi:MAG: hypothetical protein ACI9MR_000087 [Myxococcota bacterium]|jgi:hypothetical protein
MSSTQITHHSCLARAPISAPRHLELLSVVLRCCDTELDALAGRQAWYVIHAEDIE